MSEANNHQEKHSVAEGSTPIQAQSQTLSNSEVSERNHYSEQVPDVSSFSNTSENKEQSHETSLTDKENGSAVDDKSNESYLDNPITMAIPHARSLMEEIEETDSRKSSLVHLPGSTEIEELIEKHSFQNSSEIQKTWSITEDLHSIDSSEKARKISIAQAPTLVSEPRRKSTEMKKKRKSRFRRMSTSNAMSLSPSKSFLAELPEQKTTEGLDISQVNPRRRFRRERRSSWSATAPSVAFLTSSDLESLNKLNNKPIEYDDINSDFALARSARAKKVETNPRLRMVRHKSVLLKREYDEENKKRDFDKFLAYRSDPHEPQKKPSRSDSFIVPNRLKSMVSSQNLIEPLDNVKEVKKEPEQQHVIKKKESQSKDPPPQASESKAKVFIRKTSQFFNLQDVRRGISLTKVTPATSTVDEETGLKSQVDSDQESVGSTRAKKFMPPNSFKKENEIPKFIILPSNPFKIAWDIFMLVLVIYFLFVIPLELGFGQQHRYLIEDTPRKRKVDNFFIGVFSIDICMNFFVAIYANESETLVTDHGSIAVAYLKSWFFLDLVATVPISMLFSTEDSVGNFNNLARLTRLVRLFRILRIARLLPRLQENIRIYPGLLRLLKLLGVLFVFLHWVACMYFLLASHEDFGKGKPTFYRESGNQWVPPPTIWCMDQKDCNETEGELSYDVLGYNPFEGVDDCFESGRCPASLRLQYLHSLFWAIMATVGVGDDIKPVTTHELLFSIAVIVSGVVIMATLIATSSGALASLQSTEVATRINLHRIGGYLKDLEVQPELTQRIIGYYSYLWSSQNSTKDADQALEGLHYSLKMDLDIALHQEIIESIPIFKALKETPCLFEIITKLQSRVYIPGEYVVIQGEIGSEMHVVVKGQLKVIITEGSASTVIGSLRNGEAFGEIGLLLKQRREASVRAITYSEILHLCKIDFDAILQQYPQLFARVIRLAGFNNVKDGWNRVRQALKLAKMCRMFGTKLTMDDLLGSEYQHEKEKSGKKNDKNKFEPALQPKKWQRLRTAIRKNKQRFRVAPAERVGNDVSSTDDDI